MNHHRPTLVLLAFPALASAQFTDSVGHNYNNANSALIGTMIQNNVRANMLRSSLYGAMTLGNARTLPRGSKSIGGAPAAFQPRPFPIEKWLTTWSGGDLEKRKVVYAEWLRQKAIWAGEAKARGTKPNDLAQVMATAFVLAYEAYTGSRASDEGYRRMVAEFGKGFAKDAGLRGSSNDRKNELAEGALLDSTDAAMHRRSGNAAEIEKARETSGKFLDRWWDDGRAAAVRMLASTGGGAAPTAASYASALKLTSFHRVAPTVLPEKLRATMKENRDMAEKVSRQLLGEVRQGLTTNGAGDVPVDNVARGIVYALLMLHNVALSSPGQEVGQGVQTPDRAVVVELRRKLILSLAGNKELQGMSDRDKQELTEMLYFLPAFTDFLYRAGKSKGNLDAQRAARDIARKSFQNFFGSAPEGFAFK